MQIYSFFKKHILRVTQRNNEKLKWGPPLELAHGIGNARGVAILLRNGFDYKLKQNNVYPPVDTLVFK